MNLMRAIPFFYFILLSLYVESVSASFDKYFINNVPIYYRCSHSNQPFSTQQNIQFKKCNSDPADGVLIDYLIKNPKPDGFLILEIADDDDEPLPIPAPGIGRKRDFQNLLLVDGEPLPIPAPGIGKILAYYENNDDRFNLHVQAASIIEFENRFSETMNSPRLMMVDATPLSDTSTLYQLSQQLKQIYEQQTRGCYILISHLFETIKKENDFSNNVNECIRYKKNIQTSIY